MLQISSADERTIAALKQDIFDRQQANWVIHDGKDERVCWEIKKCEFFARNV